MRKALIFPVVLLVLLLASPSIALDDKIAFIHDISVDTEKTNKVPIPDWARCVGVMIPSIDNGAVGIEVYESADTAYQNVAAALLLSSADTNWIPVLDLLDGADAEICASGSDPGYIDITPLLGALRNVWIRFTMTAQTTGDTTWYMYYKE